MTHPLSILDLHAHLVAVDPAETAGGWFSHARRRGLAFRWIRASGGLPRRDEGFDSRFRHLLLEQAAEAAALARAEGYAGFEVVVLAFDRPHDTAGLPLDAEADFFVPDSYAFRIAGAASGLKTGASIHPYRADAPEALRRAASRGAALVKWLPTSQDIDPADPRTVDFAAECRRLGLPLLIHTGSEGATRNRHPEWNNPRSLEPVLATGATVIAAHTGMRSLPHEPCHFEDWIDILPDWPNLFGDTAALFALRPRKLVRALDRPLVAERLVHGSDWPVPNWPGWYWPGLRWDSVRRLSRIRNPFWRDVATKRAAGLPEESFTRGWDLIKIY